MSFSDPSLVRRVLSRIDQADLGRSNNRSLINRLFNGEPPYTVAEASDNNIEWNFNNKQAAKIAGDARGRFNTNFLTTKDFFKVSLNYGPTHKRGDYGATITKEINRLMKKRLAYSNTLRETFATVVLHGAGPVMWPDKYCWQPETVGIFDFKVPSQTKVSFENMEYFGIYREFTPGKLFRMTHANRMAKKKVDPAWNMPVVDACIKYCMDHTDGYQQSDEASTWFGTNPEKFWENFRANQGYWESDAAQKIAVYDFYFQDVKSEKGGWRRCMLLQRPLKDIKTKSAVGDCGDVFIYEPKRVYAAELNHIIHCQFADFNNVSPFLYHSVRGLGFLLYDICQAANRFQCKLTESGFEQLMMLFKANDPADRDRLDKLDLRHLGIIPDGLQIVPNTERYSPNQQIVGAAIAANQNSINQNSSSFTSDAALANEKEQTLGEWAGKLSLFNQMVGNTLTLAYDYQKHQYLEICRRFCLENSTDKDVIEFQRCMMRKGVPKVYLDVEKWDVAPERIMGGGNQALAIQQAGAIFQNRFAYSPRGQAIAAHDYVLAVTQDADKARELVDLDSAPKASDATHDAELSFGTLMQGIPMTARDSVDHIETIEALQGMLNAKVQQYMQLGGIAPMDAVLGMQTVSAYIYEHIAMLSQDQSQKGHVKQYSDAQGRMDNEIKAMGQRAMEAMQAQQGGEQDGKLQAELIKAQSQSKIKEAQAGQKMQQKDQSFEADQKRRDIKLAADLADQQARSDQERALADADTAAEIQRKRFETASTVTTTE